MANTSTLGIFILITTVLTGCYCITIKPRSSWGATKEGSPARIHGAVEYVIIHHSNRANECSTESECQKRIKDMQTLHRDEYDFYDIKYNFIIAGDGNVYEGRGWGVEGRHLKDYDKKSVGIVFLGQFENSKPSARMLQNGKDLIAKGVRRGYIKSNYKLYGHRQAANITCPGTQLYNEIKTWPHWRETLSNSITKLFKNLG